MRRVRWSLGVLVGLALAASLLTCATQMPGTSHQGPLPPATRHEQGLARELEGHVRVLAHEIGERRVGGRYEALQRAAEHIAKALEGPGHRVARQTYRVDGRDVQNLEVELRGVHHPEQIVVVGAHYDSAAGTPGANDNGSGVAGLLALGRIFAGARTGRTLRLVAFVNEEPPHFQTEQMGSLVYARRCAARKEKITAMLALETMGYFSDEKGSQRYPFPFSLTYPDTGNFIAVVGNLGSRSLVREVVGTFREEARFPCEGAAVPGFITGVGWSDHWSFWQAGYPGVMITDTAPFRFPHYHTAQDRAETIDFPRLARVVEGLAQVVGKLVGGVELPR